MVDIVPGQRPVEHNLVQPVEEFGTEGALQELLGLPRALFYPFYSSFTKEYGT